jgi:signal transduction histidine kinase
MVMGFDALKKINDLNKKIPIIIMSGYFDVDILKDSYNCGFISGIIEKPFNYDYINKTIENVLNVVESYNKIISLEKKVEEYTKLMDNLISNISHEIRTPINGILAFSSLLLQQDLNQLVKQEYSNIIHESSNQLVKFVDNVIYLSKIDSDTLKNTFVIIDLYDLFKKISGRYKTVVNVKIQFNSQHYKCLLDSYKCEVILSNLIDNAIKFSDSGTVNFGYKINDNMITFYVHDQGIGIPMDEKEKIFEKFYQIDSGLSKKYQGNGMGLYITKKLVEKLNGKIWFESEVRVGSKFYVSLPLEKL